MSSICTVLTNKQISDELKFNIIDGFKQNENLNCHKTSFSFNNLIGYLEICNHSKEQSIYENDDYAILFYGCFYNVKEVVSLLVEQGYEISLKSNEVILACSYKVWGKECVKKFNGAFCFILFDKKENTIFFARDRLGKKNLYYYFENNDIVISTEMKAFFNCDFIDKRINKKVMGRYMRFGYVPCPDSILENIYKLSPGSYAIIKNEKLNIVRYWSPLSSYKENSKNLIKDYSEAKKQLEELLKICITDRINAEKPFGVYLSSGVDSSLMAALTQSINDKPINTYTIGVDDKWFNEATVAKKISEYIGTNHHEHYISVDEMLEFVPLVCEYYDEPFGDTSSIPSLVLSNFVKGSLDIAIGGDGGDEVFCGYPHYKLISLAQKYDVVGEILARILPMKIKKKLPSALNRVVENRNKKTKCQIVIPKDVGVYNKLLKYPYLTPFYEIEQEMGIRKWTIRRMLLDMQTSLPDGMIYKVEKAALSSEISARAPILDYRILEFSFRLPQEFKFSKDKTKFILRDIATDYIPEEIFNLPKRGFNIPVEEWMKKNLKNLILEFSTQEYLNEQDIFKYDSVHSMIDDMSNGNKKSGTMCWNFLMFQLWYDKYMRP